MLSIGDMVRAMAAEKGVRPTRGNLHKVLQNTIDRHGADYFAKKLITKLDKKD